MRAFSLAALRKAPRAQRVRVRGAFTMRHWLNLKLPMVVLTVHSVRYER